MMRVLLGLFKGAESRGCSIVGVDNIVTDRERRWRMRLYSFMKLVVIELLGWFWFIEFPLADVNEYSVEQSKI